MRHRKANIKLGRTASHREALLRNMATSLFEYGRISTTLSKAKALRPLADKLVGLAKAGRGDLHCLRQAAAIITKRVVLDKLFGEAADRFGDRGAGFTIMVKTASRPGDAAPMAILELTGQGKSRASVGSSGGKAGSGQGGGDRAKRVAQSAKKAAAGPPPAEPPPAEDPAAQEPAAQEPAAQEPAAQAQDARPPEESLADETEKTED